MNYLVKFSLLGILSLSFALYSMELPNKDTLKAAQILHSKVENLYSFIEEKQKENTLALHAHTIAQQCKSAFKLYNAIIKRSAQTTEKYSDIKQKLNYSATILEPYLLSSHYENVTDEERVAVRLLQETLPLNSLRISVENIFQSIGESIKNKTLDSDAPSLAKAIKGLFTLHTIVIAGLQEALESKRISHKTHALFLEKIEPTYLKLQHCVEHIPSYFAQLEPQQESKVPELPDALKEKYPELEEFENNVQDFFDRIQKHINQDTLSFTHALNFYQELRNHYDYYKGIRQFLRISKNSIDETTYQVIDAKLKAAHDILDDIAEKLQEHTS